MLERLNEALEECKVEKALAEEVNFEEEIKRDREEAERKIRAEYEAKKAESVRDYEYQIRALEKLVAKEKARVEAEIVACEVTANEDADENADANNTEFRTVDE